MKKRDKGGLFALCLSFALIVCGMSGCGNKQDTAVESVVRGSTAESETSVAEQLYEPADKATGEAVSVLTENDTARQEAEKNGKTEDTEAKRENTGQENNTAGSAADKNSPDSSNEAAKAVKADRTPKKSKAANSSDKVEKEPEKPAEEPVKKPEKVWVEPVYKEVVHPEETKVEREVSWVCQCGEEFKSDEAWQAHRPVP